MDLFFHEYHWSEEQVLQLTLRRLEIFMNRISVRRKNRFADEMEMHASVHGLRIEIPRIGISDQATGNALTDEEQEFAQKKMKEMAEAKIKESNGRFSHN